MSPPKDLESTQTEASALWRYHVLLQRRSGWFDETDSPIPRMKFDDHFYHTKDKRVCPVALKSVQSGRIAVGKKSSVFFSLSVVLTSTRTEAQLQIRRSEGNLRSEWKSPPQRGNFRSKIIPLNEETVNYPGLPGSSVPVLLGIRRLHSTPSFDPD